MLPVMDEEEKRAPNLMIQIILCAIASLCVVSNGMCVAYSAVALPAMLPNTNFTSPNDFTITDEESSWVSSLPHLSMIIGCLLIGFILDQKGRRFGLLATCIPAFIGWWMISLGNNLWFIYIGRVLTGLSMGISGPATSVFVTEISSTKTRGFLTVLKTVGFSLGVTLTYILGLYNKTNWRHVAVYSALFPTLTLILIILIVPESKIWKTDPRRGSIFKLIGNTLKNRPEVRKPLILMSTLFFLRQMAGTTVIIGYAINLWLITGLDGDAWEGAISIGVTRLVAGVLAAWLSGVVGRRLPVTLMGTAMSASMLWLSYPPDNPIPYVPTIVLIAFVASSTIFSAIPQGMIAEVFPTDVRGVCSSMVFCILYATAFISLKIYPMLLFLLGKSRLFMFYGLLSVCSTLVAIFFLPETQGKTFAEIEKIFNKTKDAEVMENEIPLTKNNEDLKY